jgi:hypothetical protein
VIFRSLTVRAFALLALLLACLLASAPARLLGLVLPAELVAMQGFSGTLWQGQAGRCLVKTGAGYLHLGAVSWALEPLSLVWLAPHINLRSNWGGQTLAADLALRSSADLDIRRLEASLPADLLRQFVPLELTGLFSLQLEDLSLRDGLPVAGNGRLVWQGGGWNSPSGPLPLGSYALDFTQAVDTPLRGQVVTLAGPVSAQGSVQLQQRAYEIDILVGADNGLDERLQQALSLMARPEGEGYRLKLDGQF